MTASSEAERTGGRRRRRRRSRDTAPSFAGKAEVIAAEVPFFQGGRGWGWDAAAGLAWKAEVLAGAGVERRCGCGCGAWWWDAAASLAFEAEVVAVYGGSADLAGYEKRRKSCGEGRNELHF